MEKKMPTGNYAWYKLVKDTKEYSVKFTECQNKWFFQKIIVPSDSECGIINNGLESIVSQLAWYAQLSDTTSAEEKNFLTAYGNFKAQCQTSEARSDGSGVYMALGGGASLLFSLTAPWMINICYPTNKVFYAALTTSVATLATGIGLLVAGSKKVDSCTIYRNDDVINAFLEYAKVVKELTYESPPTPKPVTISECQNGDCNSLHTPAAVNSHGDEL
jgi:hypothetical protein